MAAILFLIRKSLPVILMLMLLLKSGRSDRCGVNETKKIVAETHVCDDGESSISYTAINVHSYGVLGSISQCNCSVNFNSATNNVTVAYLTNSRIYGDCGLQVKLGNSKTFACKSQLPANVSRFNVIKFSRKSNSSSNMCLTIRSDTPLTISCQRSPIDYRNTDDDMDGNSENRESNDNSTAKYSTTQTDTAMLVGIFVPLTVILIIVLAALCIRYKYKKHKKDSRPITEDSAIAQPLDTATNNRATEDEETTVTYNVAYGLVIPTRADNSRPNYDEDTTDTYNVAYNMDIPTDKNAKKTEIPTKPDNQTELEEATVTYNVAYNMEIPPSYPANNANTHNTGTDPDNVNGKA